MEDMYKDFKKVEDIVASEMKEAIVALNNSGLIDEIKGAKKIAIVGRKNVDKYETFIEYVDELIDRGFDKELSKKENKAIAAFYNTCLIEEEPEADKKKKEEKKEEVEASWESFEKMSKKDLDKYCDEYNLVTSGDDYKDNLDEYQRDVAIEAGVEVPEKKEKPKRTRRGRSADTKKETGEQAERMRSAKPRSCYGHMSNALSGKLDVLLQEGSTYKGIMDELKVKRSRITSHLKALKDKGLTLLEKVDEKDPGNTSLRIKEKTWEKASK